MRDHGTIRFAVAQAGPVRLAAYDLLGREVAVLVDGSLPAGPQRLTWTASGLAPGTYVLRLTAGDASVSRAVVVVR